MLTGRQRRRQRIAALDVLRRLLDGLREHLVAGGVLGDPQRLQDRNAVLEQRAQDAREARQGEVEVDAADHRQADPPAVQPQPPALASRPAFVGKDREDDPAHHEVPALLHEVADADQVLGQHRQLVLLFQLLEDRLEHRHDEDH